MEQAFSLPPPDVIHETAKKVLSRSDYNLDPDSTDYVTLVERIVKAVVRFFRAVAEMWTALFEMSPILGWLVIVAMIVLAAVMILHIIYSFNVALSSRKPKLALDRLDEDRVEGPETLERKARDSASSQDYIAALRHLLRAGMLRLEAAQKKRPRWAATNREYLKRYRNTPAFEPLGWMVDLVDRKWYGADVCSSVDYETGLQVYSRIRAASEEMLRAHRP